MRPPHLLITPATQPTTDASSPDAPAIAGAVDLWSARIAAPADGAAMSVLDRDERARAGRFRFPIDRDRYVARHVFLRQVLAGYLGTTPQGVRIHTTRLGRPELDAPCSLDFSISHSDGRALVAVSRGGRVGVDIERVRHLDDALDLAADHMTEREVACVRSVPLGSRSRAFLELWTRKEAAVKAMGLGLSQPLDRFDTGEPGPDGVSSPTGLPGDPAMGIVGLVDPDGFVAAVALERHRPTVRHMTRSEAVA